jgi:hypothetical protein
MSVPESRVNASVAGYPCGVPARPYSLVKPGKRGGGTGQGELPCIPKRLPDELPQSHAPRGVTRPVVELL